MSNVSDLERNIEQTRTELAGTIDQLLYRASPKTIASREAASVKAHFVDPVTGEPRTQNILVVVGTVVGVAALFATLRQLSK